MTPEELIDRVERLIAPSFAIERRIMYTVEEIPMHMRSDGDKPPAYTASVDGALRLVDRVGYRLWTVDASVFGNFFTVMLASANDRELLHDDGRPYQGRVYAVGRQYTLALAITVAALKAWHQDKCPDETSVAEDQRG